DFNFFHIFMMLLIGLAPCEQVLAGFNQIFPLLSALYLLLSYPETLLLSILSKSFLSVFF
ncbi:hypothetical protein, partial [Bacteroides uniformis]|uniref:hypothetical protein n=1 Tax=Bacteroides uniformis TaxID=820 RepID=UPI001AA12AC2